MASRVWLLRRFNDSNLHRPLRLYIMRLYAETECFKAVLKAIKSGEIAPSERSMESDNLQKYLNLSTWRLQDFSRKTDTMIPSGDVREIAREAIDTVSAGELVSIMQTLKGMRIRPQIYNKVGFIAENVVAREVNMGDVYKTGPIKGSFVGPTNIHAHSINFNQTWEENSEVIDIEALARELADLTSFLRNQAKPGNDDAMRALRNAELEANRRNGPKTLSYLAKAGQWALDVAKEIGKDVAAAAIKLSLGIP